MNLPSKVTQLEQLLMTKLDRYSFGEEEKTIHLEFLREFALEIINEVEAGMPKGFGLKTHEATEGSVGWNEAMENITGVFQSLKDSLT